MASKKAVLVYILEILKSETDANHTLSQEEIRSILASVSSFRISSIYTRTAFLDAIKDSFYK